MRRGLSLLAAVALVVTLVPSVAIGSAALWELAPDGQHPLSTQADIIDGADQVIEPSVDPEPPTEPSGGNEGEGEETIDPVPPEESLDPVETEDPTEDAENEASENAQSEEDDEEALMEEEESLGEESDEEVDLLAYTGSGTQTDPYRIATVDDLKQLAAEVNAGQSHAGEYFRLVADITSGWDGFPAIGSVSDPAHGFSGNFNGGGHRLSGLGLNRGLFAMLNAPASGQIIENLILDGTLTATGDRAGLLTAQTGTAGATTIRNCTVTGAVNGGTCAYVGGVVGVLNPGSSITQCNTSIALTAGSGTSADSGKGTVVGMMVNASVTNCYATGSVSTSWVQTGGVVGYAVGGSSRVSGIFSDMNVTGAVIATGGVVGKADQATVTACRYKGRLQGATYVGGIVGDAYRTALITNNLAEGSVIATASSSGGILGGISLNAGSNSNATITGNLSILQSTVTGASTSAPKRVWGIGAVVATTPNNNYAWSGMTVNGSTITQDNPIAQDGADVTREQLLSTASIAPPMAGWVSPWAVTAGAAPQITTIARQPGWPSYIVGGTDPTTPPDFSGLPEPVPDDGLDNPLPMPPEQEASSSSGAASSPVAEDQRADRIAGALSRTGDDAATLTALFALAGMLALMATVLTRKQAFADRGIPRGKHARHGRHVRR